MAGLTKRELRRKKNRGLGPFLPVREPYGREAAHANGPATNVSSVTARPVHITTNINVGRTDPKILLVMAFTPSFQFRSAKNAALLSD
jgi:hypothetical protein